MKLKNILPSKIKNSLLLTTIVLISSLLFSSQTDSNYLNNFFDDIVGSISADKTEVCINEPATITFKAENGTAPYTFTYSENGVEKPTVTSEVDGAYSFSYKNSTPDDYVFILTKVVDKDGTSQSITGEQVVIKVNTPPTAVFTFNNDNSCSGETIKFTNSSTGEGNLSYNWDFGDSKTSPQKEPTHIFEALGCGTKTFNVKLTVTDGSGCSASKTETISVKEKPDFAIYDVSEKDFSNCGNATTVNPDYEINVGLDNGDSCITSYNIKWGDGDEENNVSFPIKHNYATLGVYNMIITANNSSNGCNKVIKTVVKNISNPSGSIVNPGSTQNLCAPTSAIPFIISSWGENSLDTRYEINYGDGTTLTLQQEDLVTSIYYNSSNPANSTNYPVPHIYTESSCPGTYTASLNIINACATTPSNLPNISILEKPKLAFSFIDKSCVNKQITFINNSIYGHKDGCSESGRFTWDFGDGKTTGSSTSLNTQTHSYSSPGKYTVTLSATSFCGSIEITKEICIEPEITPTFSVDNEEGCIPFAVAVTNTIDKTDLCSEPTYLWSVSYSSLNCGTSSDWEFKNGTTATSENPEFLFINPGKYTIIQRVTTGCGTETTTKTIDVKKPPTVSINNIDDACGNLTVIPTATIENCTTDTSALTYNWTFSGGSPATATTLNPGNIEFTTPGIHTITLEVTNDCGVSNTATEEFTISETPIITNADLTQEICSGQNTSEIIFTSNNASITYSWSAVASSGITGFIPSGTSNTIPSQVLKNTQNSTKTVIYTVIPSLNGCDGDAVDFVITVNPAPIITTHPISSEICLDGTATELEVEFQNGAGTASYQWYSNTVDNASTGTLIAGATNPTYNAPTNTVGTTYYYAVISFTSGGCSEIKSNTAIVKVVEQFTIKTITAPQAICIGGAVNALEFSVDGGTGTATYQWFSNTTDSNIGGTLIAGAKNATYKPTFFSSAGTYFYYVEIYLDGNGCNSATSAVYQIDVFTGPVIDAQAIATQELCQSSIPEDLIVVVSGGTTTQKTYQWYVNTDSATNGSSVVSGATSATYTPPTDTVGSLYYYVVVTQAESGCAVESDISHVKVNESPIISKQPISSEICLDGTATELEVAYANGTGTASYQWYSNTVDDASTGTLITGETNTTYNPPTNTVGTTYYYAVISFTSGGCSEIISTTAAVKVVEQLTIAPVAATQTVCIGGTANEMEVTYSGGTGNATYQWFSNTSNLSSGGTMINGATNSKYTPSSFSAAGNFYYYAEISLNGNGCSSANSAAFQIEVVPDPVIDTQPIANQELCQNSIPEDLIVVVSGGTTSTKTYQWYQNNTNSNSGGTLIPGEVSATFTPNTTNVGTFYYYVMVSQPEAGCSITSAISTLIVNTAPTFSKQPISSEICLDGTATELEVEFQNGAGTASYQWYSNTVDNASTGTLITGETNTTYNAPTNTVGTTYYYAVISFTSGGCSEIISDTAHIIVNEIPVINNVEITVYSEITFNLDPSSIAGNVVPNGTKYIWSTPTFNPAGSILGSSEATVPQDQISQTLENTGTSPITVTYLITAATTKCAGDSFILEVTVNPSINSNAIVTNNNCFESNDGSISTNIDGGVPFETGNPYLISWSGPNGFTSTNTTITNLEVGLYTITIEDKSGFTFTEEFNITQPTTLTIVKDLEKDISCFQGNDGAIAVTISGGTLPYTYLWTTTDGSGIVPNSENQNLLTAGNYTLEITDKNNCTTSTNFELTEPEGLKIETAFKQDILCFGDATGALEITVSGGTTIEISSGVFDYLYSWSGPNGFTSSSKNISNLITGTYTLAVTDALGCTTNTSIIINQSSEIKINYTKTDVTCYGETNGAIDVTVIGGVTPYKISWSNLANGFSQSNLSAGTYVATITDGNNCIAQVSIPIEQPLFFIAPVVSPISCNGANDGSINLHLTGGISPIFITWSDDASAGVERNNLAAGTYTVVVLDSDTHQCPIEQTFTFTNPPAIGVSSTVEDAIDCTIVNSGRIDLTVVGGTAPYSYNWSTGENTQDLESIPPGDYSVEITDANGCNVSRQFTVFRQEPILIDFVTSTITDCDLKTVSQKTEAKVTGGFLPYTYSWSSGTISGSDNRFMTTSQNGSYTLTVTDSKGCSESKSFLINLPTIGNPDFRYRAFALDTYDLLSIEDPIQFTNLSSGNYTNITWDFGDGSPISKEENPIHTYDTIGTFKIKLTVEYDAGCTYIVERTVTITLGCSLVNPTAFTPNGDGYNETIRPNFNGFIEVEMNIYDSWGTLVFYEKGITLQGWNGLIKNAPAENGNYIMVVKGLTFYKKEIITTTPVTLLK
jgi:gliding motility-associated-like protein